MLPRLLLDAFPCGDRRRPSIEGARHGHAASRTPSRGRHRLPALTSPVPSCLRS